MSDTIKTICRCCEIEGDCIDGLCQCCYIYVQHQTKKLQAVNANLKRQNADLLAACKNVLYITHNKSQGTGGPDYKACFTAKQMNEIGNVLRAAIAVAKGK